MAELDWVSYREAAVIFWLVVVLAISIYLPNIRGSLKTLVVLLFSPPILTVVIWVAVAIGCGLLIFEPSGGWTKRHLWISFLWFVTVGVGLTFKAGTNDSSEWGNVWSTLTGALSITAVFDFVVNFRSLSLLTEIILVPILFFAVWCTMSKDEEETTISSRSIGNGILVLVGMLWLWKSGYSIYIEPNDFFSLENLRSFYLPFLLCLCSTPIVVATFILSVYQRILTSIGLTLKDSELYRYACRAAILRFNINVKALDEWRRIVHSGNTTTTTGIDQTIYEAILAARQAKQVK